MRFLLMKLAAAQPMRHTQCPAQRGRIIQLPTVSFCFCYQLLFSEKHQTYYLFHLVVMCEKCHHYWQ